MPPPAPLLFPCADGTLVEVAELGAVSLEPGPLEPGSLEPAALQEGPAGAPLFLVLPCMSGDARLYPLRYDGLVRLGYRVILFNPRGHGRSGGVYSLEDTMRDLRAVLEARGAWGARIFGVGHSGGGSALLRMADLGWPIDDLVLLSPIVDTRRSARFKYEGGTAKDLVETFRPRRGRSDVLHEVLATDDWLAPDVWHGRGLKERIDEEARDEERPGHKPGTLMEHIFHPGWDLEAAARRHAPRCRCLVPSVDTWYPTSELTRLFGDAGGEVHTVASARDHFFRGGFWEIGPMLERFAAASRARAR